MSSKLNRWAYGQLVAEDIAWLMTCPRTLEREHVILIVKGSVEHHYGPFESTFTIEYKCDACGISGVKLWRGVHGAKDKDGNELRCARCLAPHVEVDDNGKSTEDGLRSDQVAGWLPAVPADDTFWDYSSVPAEGVEWWKALPTYTAPVASLWVAP